MSSVAAVILLDYEDAWTVDVGRWTALDSSLVAPHSNGNDQDLNRTSRQAER
jgi:hypothetical protein